MSPAEIAQSGPLIAAIGVSAFAGLISFLSPCVLPLAPAYLSYVTGLAGADLDAVNSPRAKGSPPATAQQASGASSGNADTDGGAAAGAGAATLTRRRVRGQVLAGSALFIAGFTVIFVILSVTVSALGRTLLLQQRAIEIGAGLLIVVLGLTFLGAIPGMQRELRFRRLPAAGLAGAPVLGAVFAFSWIPCVSPTLGAVLGLAAVQGSATRGAVLATAYGIGLGLPFLLFGMGFRWVLGLFQVIRRHSLWVVRIGGVMLVLLGLGLVTGVWEQFIIWLQSSVGSVELTI
ncbi:MAG: cytochrome c biogenesis CcdA family protein [Micromonosporaceae bacterium]